MLFSPLSLPLSLSLSLSLLHPPFTMTLHVAIFTIGLPITLVLQRQSNPNNTTPPPQIETISSFYNLNNTEGWYSDPTLAPMSFFHWFVGDRVYPVLCVLVI